MAYAAVIHAKQKIERLFHPPQTKILHSDADAGAGTKSIYEELCSLESLLRRCALMQGRNLRFDPLEQRIEDLADQIDDMVESYVSPHRSETETLGVESESESDSTLALYQKLFCYGLSACSPDDELENNGVHNAGIIDLVEEYSRLRIDASEVAHIEDAADQIRTLSLVESHTPPESDICSLEKSGSGRSPKNESNDPLVLSQKLFQVAQEIGSLMQELENIIKEYDKKEREEKQGTADFVISSRIYDFGSQNEPVGLDEEEEELSNWIARAEYYHERAFREIMCVVGMVGIGKTTLVRKVYEYPRFAETFNLRYWMTVGPNYKFREFALDFLDYVGGYSRGTTEKMVDDELGISILKHLWGRRYLIVLDDVWSSHVWDELKQIFPNEKTSSLIIMISRLLNVASGVADKIHVKSFLDDELSWDLLNRAVFTGSGVRCSYQLEKLGREIAKNCEGLPLAILAVGKHLGSAIKHLLSAEKTVECWHEKTVEYWEEVSKQENLPDIIKDDYANIYESLALSYRMLPRCLKECFLYIGIIPNYEISVSKLIKLWIVEGFIGQEGGKSIEETAEGFLQDAISQSVVLIRKHSTTRGRIKICRVHFVFRSLCVTEAQNEKFCQVIKKYAYNFPKGTNLQRRLSIHNNVVLGIKEVHNTLKNISKEFSSSVRSFLCLGPQHDHPLRVFFSFKLLKVLSALSIRFFEFPDQVLELVRLRYLAITYDWEIPNSISQLWNLEVLIVGRHHSIISLDNPSYLPVEVWNLKWLRHLQCKGIDMPDPCKWGSLDANVKLEHLLTLSNVSSRSCSQEILARVPNLEKLGIRIELAPNEVENFSFFGDISKVLHNLVSFKCVVLGLRSQLDVSSDLVFASTLRKITLSGCRFPWSSMTVIGLLPYLEILKLRCYSFCGPKWDPCEGEFLRLKVLLLEDLDLEEWNGDNYNYPVLQHLMIRHCYKLHNIPLGIGDIPTLTLIELDDCSPSLANSAKEIQEDQIDLGNEDLQVCINSSWNDKKSM